MEIAISKGLEINSPNQKKRSRKKDASISSNTTQKKIKPTSGVRITRILFVPVAILYIRLMIHSRNAFIYTRPVLKSITNYKKTVRQINHPVRARHKLAGDFQRLIRQASLQHPFRQFVRFWSAWQEYGVCGPSQ